MFFCERLKSYISTAFLFYTVPQTNLIDRVLNATLCPSARSPHAVCVCVINNGILFPVVAHSCHSLARKRLIAQSQSSRW